MVVPPLWGWSVGDLFTIINLVRRTYRRCRAAGDEYRHFSHLVYSLRHVLRTVEREFHRPGSILTRRESDTFVLAETIADCAGILEIVRDRLERYQRTHSLSCLRRTWDRVRFGVADVAADLSTLETRLTTKIAFIMLQLDIFNVPAVAQVQTTLDTTRQEINHGIVGIQSTLYDIARQLPQRRFPQRLNSESSVEEGWSHIDEEIWTQVKQELINLRFSRAEIHRSRRVLKAYIRMRVAPDGGDINPTPGTFEPGRPSPQETSHEQQYRIRRGGEQSRGRTASRGHRSHNNSRRRGSRWDSSAETLVDTSPSQSPPRRSRGETNPPRMGLQLTNQNLFYIGLGAAAAATVLVIALESNRKRSRARKGRVRSRHR
jgi:hypothetical protein